MSHNVSFDYYNFYVNNLIKFCLKLNLQLRDEIIKKCIVLHSLPEYS